MVTIIDVKMSPNLLSTISPIFPSLTEAVTSKKRLMVRFDFKFQYDNDERQANNANISLDH